MTLEKKRIIGLSIVFVIAQFFQLNKNQGHLEAINVFFVKTQAPKQVMEETMLLAPYTWTHKELLLDGAQVHSLEQWKRSLRSSYTLNYNHN